MFFAVAPGRAVPRAVVFASSAKRSTGIESGMNQEQTVRDRASDAKREEVVTLEKICSGIGKTEGFSEVRLTTVNCMHWRLQPIEINNVEYQVTRRPRLFRYADMMAAENPDFIDLKGYEASERIDDGKYQQLVYESKLWCLEFDVDKQGDRKTLRISFEWPGFFPTFENINQPSEIYPQGLLTFLGHSVFPISVRVNDTDPKDCAMTAAIGDWSSVREIRYVCYENTPFGMLEEDREEAEQHAPARAANATDIGGGGGGMSLERRRERGVDEGSNDTVVDVAVKHQTEPVVSDYAIDKKWGKLEVHEWDVSVIFYKHVFNIKGPVKWSILRELLAGKGTYVHLTAENPPGHFSGTKKATKFFKSIAEAQGQGAGGTKKYRLRK